VNAHELSVGALPIVTGESGTIITYVVSLELEVKPRAEAFDPGQAHPKTKYNHAAGTEDLKVKVSTFRGLQKICQNRLE